MSNYTTIEPTVIDEELLKKSVNDQVSQEIADVARREGIEFNTVISLRLDYKNLSFNNISVIEGLEGLTKLTDLTLYNNRIKKIENLDGLVELNVLSIGNNNLSLLEDMAYLCKFENLKVLNATGNNICKNPNYRNYLLSHLRKLKYLDYRLVDKVSVEEARQQYMDDLIALEEEEKISTTKKEDKEKIVSEAILYNSAHIGGINKLFHNMFSEDSDFQRIFAIDKLLITEQRNEYEAKFEPFIEELKKFALKRAIEVKDECNIFNNCKAEAKIYHDDLCIKELNSYQHMKKQLFKVIHANKEVDVDECIKRLREKTQILSDVLLSHEMQLVDQFEEVIKEFERNYTELTNGVNEMGQNCFAHLRELENEYHEHFSETVLLCFDRFNKGDIEDVEDDIRDLMGDKDALVNAVNSSHDFRLGKLDHQEDVLVSGVTKSTEVLVLKTREVEIERNRNRICEIITYLDKCYLEIGQVEESY